MIGLPRRPWRCVHGSHSSTPSATTSPTRNRLPTRSFRATPRVVRLRRVSPGCSSITCSRASRSSDSASTSVSSSPRCDSSHSPGLSSFRSPRMPMPLTSSTAGTDSTGPLLVRAMWMCSTIPMRELWQADALDPDRLLDQDHGGGAGHEIALHDEDPRHLRPDAELLAQPAVLVGEDVLVDAAQRGVQVGHQLL